MESLWLSGRASERGIRRSEARFHMGTQNFSLFHARDKTKKTSFQNSKGIFKKQAFTISAAGYAFLRPREDLRQSRKDLPRFVFHLCYQCYAPYRHLTSSRRSRPPTFPWAKNRTCRSAYIEGLELISSMLT